MDKATDCLETKTAVRGTRLNPFANLKQSPHAAGNCFPGHATFHIHVQCLCMSPEGGDLQAWISDSVVPPHGKLFLTLIPGCIQTRVAVPKESENKETKTRRLFRSCRVRTDSAVAWTSLPVSHLWCWNAFLAGLTVSTFHSGADPLLSLSSGRDVWNRNSEVVRPKKTEAQRGKRY
ncbi:PREDICTED: uncharacterized protein LOC108448259 isoform X4 [Corvus brachyrhynchos]|uniref:uncharacterized protein LOC108448259 isoform X4 n=1 Tax=Corvus brachyrhynchos TaxID=85066 RepID=UPI0008166767|nr:PREDICTED: uncharacterized protein LOC108448259 isoform X4 [Corvus brachyrhynchos]